MSQLAIDPLHAARLAMLEGSMVALLREAAQGEEPNEQPDRLVVTLTADGLDLEYWRGRTVVAGEGV